MKKLITLTLLLLVTALTATSVVAQSEANNYDVNIQQVDQEVNLDRNSFYLSDELTGVFTNSTFIGGVQQLAMDANQVARINTTGDNNTAMLTQSGNNNIGIINIDGSNNTANLTQSGNRLLSSITIQGTLNDLNVSQDGNNLQNFILLEGRDINFNIDQTAAGTQVRQTGTSNPLMVTTSGNSVPIIIRNN